MNDKMKHPFLVGRKIYLRGLEESDLEGNYLEWLNDPDVNRYMESGRFPTTKEKLKEFYQKIVKSDNDIIFAIIDKKSNKHIGNIKLGSINWIHKNADVGIMIGEKSFWSKGYGTEAIKLVVEYAFKKLNLHKIVLGVYADHKAAIKSYEKAGFRVEGVQKEQLYLDGKYHDKILMGITRT